MTPPRSRPKPSAPISAPRRVTCDTDRRILEQLIQTDGLVVVGAEYSLESGVVDFFDGVPGPA